MIILMAVASQAHRPKIHPTTGPRFTGDFVPARFCRLQVATAAEWIEEVSAEIRRFHDGHLVASDVKLEFNSTVMQAEQIAPCQNGSIGLIECSIDPDRAQQLEEEFNLGCMALICRVPRRSNDPWFDWNGYSKMGSCSCYHNHGVASVPEKSGCSSH